MPAAGVAALADAGHLDLELERDLVVVVDARRDVDVGADVAELEVAGQRLRGAGDGAERRGLDRHLVAEPQRHLLAVERAQRGPGQRADVARVLLRR